MGDTAADANGTTSRCYFQALFELARVVNSSLEPEVVLDDIVRHAALAMGVKASTIRLLEERTGRLVPAACYGLSHGYIRKGPVDLRHSRIDVEVVDGRIVQVADAPNDPRVQYPDRLRQEGVASLLVVPLTVGDDHIIGVLRVYAAEPRTFSDDDVRFLSAAADLSAVALENARLHQALRKEFDLVHAYDFQLFED